MFKKSILLGVLLALLLSAFTIAVSAEAATIDWAERPHPRPTPSATPTAMPDQVVVTGEVLSVGRDHFMLAANNGQRYKIVVSNETRFWITGVESPTLKDVRQGDQAVVTGHPSLIAGAVWPSEIRATNVVIRRPQHVRLVGTVSDIQDTNFVLSGDAGRHLVYVGASTRVVIPGVEDPELSDIPEGARALVVGTLRENTDSVMPVVDASLVAVERPEPRPVTVAGIVESVAESSLVLARGEARHTIYVDDDTEITIPGMTDPTLADIRVGDQAVAVGYPRDDTSSYPAEIDAIKIAIRRPEMVRVAGIVREIAPEQFLLAVENRAFTIHVRDDTQFEIVGIENPSYADLQIGMKAIVVGLPHVNMAEVSAPLPDEIDAHKVTVPEPRPVRLVGEVKAKSDDHFLLENDQRQHTVHVSSETVFEIPGIENPTYDHLQVGMQAIAIGYPHDATTEPNALPIAIDAEKVIARKPEPRPITVRGQVADKGEDHFTLQTADLRYMVYVSNETLIRIPGVENPTFANIREGETVAVHGLPREDTPTIMPTLDAQWIFCYRPVIGRVYGEVTDVYDSGLALRTKDGRQIQVKVNNSTKIVIPGIENPTLANISVGDHALVIFEMNLTEADPAAREADGLEDGATVVARSIAVDPHDQVTLTGLVREIVGETIVLELRDGDIKRIGTNRSTQYFIAGIENAGLADLKVGAKAVVTARVGEDGSLTALVVRAQNPKPKPVSLRGTIHHIDEQSFGLETEAGELVEIMTDAETRFMVPGMPGATLADLPVGAQASVLALPQEDGLLAKSVIVRQIQPEPGKAVGKVIAKEGLSLVVETQSGPVTVLTDSDTRFHLPGVKDGTIEDVEIGAQILAIGVWTSDGALQAKHIMGAPDLPVIQI